MTNLNFDEVRVFDDALEYTDILRDIIRSENQEDAFHIADIGDMVRKHRKWTRLMPRVTPHFAVKCNSENIVVKILAALNAHFDCASQQEISQVMQHGVSAERIVFANPMKQPSHIKYAKKVGVERTTADSEVELLKIKELYPEARVIIRFRNDATLTQCSLGRKFGCDPDTEAGGLMKMMKSLGLKLEGFSFHAGSPCDEVTAYSRGIGVARRLIDIAKTIGLNDARLIDIGGGMPGESYAELESIANEVNRAIEDLDPSIEVISEPGRYYVTSAFSLAAYLHGKKVIYENGELRRMYYVNDGVYGSFIEELLDLRQRVPVPLFNHPIIQPISEEKYPSTVWGPTCDTFDCILKDVMLPELYVGDWLAWNNMGSYSLALATPFNGFSAPAVYPVVRKSDWESFLAEVKTLQNFKRTDHDKNEKKFTNGFN